MQECAVQPEIPLLQHAIVKARSVGVNFTDRAFLPIKA